MSTFVRVTKIFFNKMKKINSHTSFLFVFWVFCFFIFFWEREWTSNHLLAVNLSNRHLCFSLSRPFTGLFSTRLPASTVIFCSKDYRLRKIWCGLKAFVERTRNFEFENNFETFALALAKKIPCSVVISKFLRALNIKM